MKLNMSKEQAEKIISFDSEECTAGNPDMFLISREHYDELIADQNLLNALYATGVGDWEGFEIALKEVEEE